VIIRVKSDPVVHHQANKRMLLPRVFLYLFSSVLVARQVCDAKNAATQGKGVANTDKIAGTPLWIAVLGLDAKRTKQIAITTRLQRDIQTRLSLNGNANHGQSGPTVPLSTESQVIGNIGSLGDYLIRGFLILNQNRRAACATARIVIGPGNAILGKDQ
jgi:hypothetical protein